MPLVEQSALVGLLVVESHEEGLVVEDGQGAGFTGEGQ
jgi:hypothetical protein